MAIVFKSDKREPVVLTKQGDAGEPTIFYFDLPPGKRRQMRLNIYMSGTRDVGGMINESFRVALYRWENLIGPDGKDVPYSDAVRDALVNESDVFTDDDVLEIAGMANEKKTAGETSTTGSEPPCTGDGPPSGVSDATTAPDADSRADDAT